MERNTMLLERLSDRPDPRAFTPEVVALIHAAGNPFYDWFLGGPAQAAASVGHLLGRPSSEIAASRVIMLVEGNRLAGIYVGVEGAALPVCRKADTLALLDDAASPEARSALVTRMRETRDLFAPVAADELYLSKIAVAPDLQGRGFGRALLEHFLAAGGGAGFRRFRLDVAADNASAIALYRSAGFVIESQRAGGGLWYVAMTLVEGRFRRRRRAGPPARAPRSRGQPGR